MIEYTTENYCVSCERCVNCGRNKKVKVLEDLICDKCKKSSDVLYDVDGDQLCANCILLDYEEINEETFEEFI